MTTVLGDRGMEFGFGCNNAPSKNTIYCKMTTLEVALVNEPAMITASFRSGVVTAMIDPHENFPVELVERAIGP